MTTAIIFLTAILADFTFETTVNKTKVYNVQDKARAKLNAESGLRFAMARLRIYKEARNQVAANKSVSGLVSPEMLNTIWSFPFAYPIDIPEDTNVITKDLIQEFSENSVIDGSLQVFITNASDLLNINLLRIASLDITQVPIPGAGAEEQDTSKNKEASIFIEEKLVELLNNAVENKKESDEAFEYRYADLDTKLLIKTLKYFVSDKESLVDSDMGEVLTLFNNAEIEPKHGPLASISEIYLLPGWDDELVDLIKDEITVHGELIIDLNKINENTLRIILPTLDEEQIKEFFKYRDDPSDPHYFNKESDFRQYIVSVAGFVSSDEYDKRVGDFKKAGIKFGVAGSLFRVVSTGIYGRAKTTLTAFVSFPLKPLPTPSPSPGTTPSPQPDPSAQPGDEDQDDEPDPTPSATAGSPAPDEFLEPRIVEILID